MNSKLPEPTKQTIRSRIAAVVADMPYVDFGEPDDELLTERLVELAEAYGDQREREALHDGQQVALYRFIKMLEARQKNTAPNSGAGREIKDILRELRK